MRLSPDVLSWQASAAGIGRAHITALAFSPAFAQDQALFADGAAAGVFRSHDGGQSWQELGFPSPAGVGEEIFLALSPNYQPDGALSSPVQPACPASSTGRRRGRNPPRGLAPSSPPLPWPYRWTLPATARSSSAAIIATPGLRLPRQGSVMAAGQPRTAPHQFGDRGPGLLTPLRR